jgi:beta-lactamase class A
MTAAYRDLDERLREILAAGPATGGVAVRHMEHGEAWSYDGDTVYPAASVFKIPVLVEAFRRIGAGAIALGDRWELTDAEKSTGSGVLVRLMPGLQPAVRDLLTLMIIISDNTATDMLVRRLDPERITDTMRDLGLRRTVVAQGCRELLRGIVGEAPPSLAPYEMARHLKAQPPNPASPAFGSDTDNNITTANEMLDLLGRIHTGDGMEAIGIDDKARQTMREILLLQQLNERIPRFLPATVPVAHKTGSLGGPWTVRNDAGLIDLGEQGTVGIAIFTRTRAPEGPDPTEGARLNAAIDEEIGMLARAVYDHYTSV